MWFPTIWYVILSTDVKECWLIWLQGYKGIGSSVDYSVFNPFSSSSYFHPYCLISNYNDQSSVENCWLGSTTVSLPDLDTSQSNVRTIWYNWIRDLVSKYSSA